MRPRGPTHRDPAGLDGVYVKPGTVHEQAMPEDWRDHKRYRTTRMRKMMTGFFIYNL